MRKLTLGFCLILFWLRVPMVAASVIITEVHPNPSSGPEWVELYNDTATAIDLHGWILEDQLASASQIHLFGPQSLAAQTYLKIDLSSQKLNNTSDGVTLKDATGTIIATMSYQSTTSGLCWSRTLDSSIYFQTAPTPAGPHLPTSPTPTLSVSPTPIPTPSPTPTPSPSPSPASNPAAYLYLQPSEIQACPETGDQEWLEVYNPTDFALNVDEWHVKDAADNLRSVTATLNPHSFGSLSWSSGLLNNTGDSITLLTLENEPLFSAVFGPCQKNTSYILDQETWKLTLSVTRDQPNLLTVPTPTPSAVSHLLKTSPAPKTFVIPVALLSPAPAETSPSTVLTASTTSPLAQNQSFGVPHTATPSFSLSALIYHPFLDPPPSINLVQPLPNTPALFGVIMGGTVLMATHGLRLYRLYQHAHAINTPASQPPVRVLFP